MIKQLELTLPVYPQGFNLITSQVLQQLPPLPQTGLLHLFIKHTSAALTINENADPAVRHDLKQSFDSIVKEREPFYTHTEEGDDDMPSHIKSSTIGCKITIPITNHTLNLGTWQGIYLCEFRRHGGNRHIVVTIIGETL